MAGFTTIRNVGADRNAIFALRDAINQGIVMGPRIKAAGQGLSPTGGHGDAGGFRDDIFLHSLQVFVMALLSVVRRFVPKSSLAQTTLNRSPQVERLVKQQQVLVNNLLTRNKLH